MDNETIDAIIDDINNKKDSMSNSGTRPLVSIIVGVASEIVSNNSEKLIAIATPGPDLLNKYFKGWKAEDFERLAIELENLKT
jgi:hypothetical protein